MTRENFIWYLNKRLILIILVVLTLFSLAFTNKVYLDYNNSLDKTKDIVRNDILSNENVRMDSLVLLWENHYEEFFRSKIKLVESIIDYIDITNNLSIRESINSLKGSYSSAYIGKNGIIFSNDYGVTDFENTVNLENSGVLNIEDRIYVYSKKNIDDKVLLVFLEISQEFEISLINTFEPFNVGILDSNKEIILSENITKAINDIGISKLVKGQYTLTTTIKEEYINNRALEYIKFAKLDLSNVILILFFTVFLISLVLIAFYLFYTKEMFHIKELFKSELLNLKDGELLNVENFDYNEYKEIAISFNIAFENFKSEFKSTNPSMTLINIIDKERTAFVDYYENNDIVDIANEYNKKGIKIDLHYEGRKLDDRTSILLHNLRLLIDNGLKYIDCTNLVMKIDTFLEGQNNVLFVKIINCDDFETVIKDDIEVFATLFRDKFREFSYYSTSKDEFNIKLII
jgi:hypothetical protein